jgi:hypothetical protein
MVLLPWLRLMLTRNLEWLILNGVVGGGCNDNVAYQGNEPNKMIRAGQLPIDLHNVLDEAFCACGGPELTPFSRRSLRSLYTVIAKTII